MSKKHTVKPIAIVMGTAFAASMAMSNVASAATGNSPFAMHELSSGYMQVADKMEGNCGSKKPMQKSTEGSCGGNMKMQKDMEGKCGTKDSAKEGKCGEGKCASNKKKKVMKEGSCGGSM